MVKLRHIATGRIKEFSEGTLKAIRGIPRGWVEVEEKPVEEAPKPPAAEISREAMIEFIRAQGHKVNPSIGDEKLIKRYEDTKQEVGSSEGSDA